MKKLYRVLIIVTVGLLLLSACGSSATKADDLLNTIKQRGYILVSTDPNYAPQSFLNKEGMRLSNTKCPADAYTTAEMQGFDVDVAKAIGDRLGVETCFPTPPWDAITAGNWQGKWDISVGSMTITTSRQKILDFSIPYYYSSAVIAVRVDSGITELSQLDGKILCVATSTTYEQWLNRDMEGLGLPKSAIYAQAPNVSIITLETDHECAQAIAAGREDFIGFVTSELIVDSDIANGIPVVKLGGPVFYERLVAAFDKSSSLSTETLRAEVDKFLTQMHADGSLTKISKQWFKDKNGEGLDYTVEPK
ncbi:MAG TPA: transporter substrate-binding domain-containing protein [Anaerolineales bacterium]|nr:transporter substrate-binding domain-containing protein [Anaerolineales bacterium]